MNRPDHARFTRAALMMAAVTLAGCASSDRMMRLSPFAEVTPEAGKHAGAAQDSRMAARPLTDDRVNAFPLYYSAGGMASVCWPLVDWDERGRAVRPLYNREGDDQSVLFPLSAWDRESGWVLNTVWDDRRGWMFAPFFGSWGKTDFVFPVFVTERPGEAESAVRVFPIWYSDAHTRRVEVLYSQTRNDDGAVSREALLGLLYGDRLSGDGATRRTWLAPLAYHERDKASERWLSLPYSSGRDAEHTWSNLHPLWWSASGEGWSRETLLPVYHRSVDAGRQSVYTPLGYTMRSGDDTETTTWLYSSGRSGDSRWFNLYPLWWSSSGAEGASSSLLFPVYYDTRTAGGRGVYTPLGFSTHSEGRDSLFTWFYSAGRDGGERWCNIHPLWWSSSSEREASSLLLPLYLRVREGKTDTVYTPLGYHETSGDAVTRATLLYSSGHAGGREWLNIHPLWWSSDSENASMRALLPVYYARRAGAESATYTPLYSHGREGARHWLNVHPLWWSSDSETGSMRALLPLYYTSREGDAEATYTPLGFHETKGADARRITLLYSSGRAGGREWLNIHPLWWSSSQDGRETRTLLPVWSGERRRDGSGEVLSPFGYAETEAGGATRFVNVLGLGYQWERESDGAQASHVLWPLYAGHHAPAEVDGKFVGVVSLAAHETAPNLNAWRVTPLVSSASGPGVSPVRDWVHLVSRRTYAGETSTTLTPLAEHVTNAAEGRWRVTPLVSRAESQSDTAWRDWLHLASFRSDETGGSATLTPLCATRTARDCGGFRLTPLADVGTGRFAELTPWTPHLFVYGRAGERRAWSFTPLVGAYHTANADSERAWPFYDREVRDGRTVSCVAFPFYSEGESDTVLPALCLVRRLRTPEAERESWFGPVCTRERSRARAVADERVWSAPQVFPVESRGTLFTSSSNVARLSLAPGFVTPEEKETVRRWLSESARMQSLETLRLRPQSGAAGEIRSRMSPATEEAMRALHADALRVLARHGAAPAVESVSEMRLAFGRLAAAHTSAGEVRRFAVDPFGLTLYREEQAPGSSEWTLLFGLGRGAYRDGFGGASVLSHLYTKEVSSDGVRMNCFPFVQRDETRARSKVAFLWRVWNRETDRATGAVRGHVLFIPYGA